MKNCLCFVFFSICFLSSSFADASTAFKEAEQYYIQEEYTNALALFEKLSAKGNTKAQVYMGKMYLLGQGVPQDDIKARQWLEKAAAQGDMAAQFGLGVMHEKGQGVVKNTVKAREWYEKAAAQGSKEAKASLSRLHKEDKTKPVSSNTQTSQTTKKTEDNNAIFFYLIIFFVTAGLIKSVFRQKKNEKQANKEIDKLDQFVHQSQTIKAAPVYAQADESKGVQALGKWGAMYVNRQVAAQNNPAQTLANDETQEVHLAEDTKEVVAQEKASAQPLFIEEQEENNSAFEERAKADLANEASEFLDDVDLPLHSPSVSSSDFDTTHSKEEIHTQNRVKTIEWYEKAADEGDAQAQTDLGIMYSKGDGVTQDLARAKKLFEMAVNQGYMPAHTCLARMHECGQGATQSYVRAISLYRKAADQGDAVAQMALGHIYEKGLGVFQNEDRAKHYYELACKNGVLVACDALERLREEGH